MQTITIGDETVKQETLVLLDEQENPVTLYGGTVTIYDDGSADVVSEYTTPREVFAPFVYVGNLCFRFDNTGMSKTSDVSSIKCITDFIKYTGNANTGFNMNPQNAFFFISPTGLNYNGLPAATVNNELNPYWSEWYASLSEPPKMVASLATPVTYHFTNLEELKVWLGENNFWCDISDDISVKYWNRGFGN